MTWAGSVGGERSQGRGGKAVVVERQDVLKRLWTSVEGRRQLSSCARDDARALPFRAAPAEARSFLTAPRTTRTALGSVGRAG